jgi:hypothetical protein
MFSSSDPDIASTLTAALADGQVFAVVDAAFFEYLQDTLQAARLTFDPLYLDEVDAPSVASGPHLVHVDTDADMHALLELLDDKQACVWWIWPDTRGAVADIYRHLRRLNMVKIPKDRYDADRRDRQPGAEAVLLRHGDPAIVSLLLRVMSESQKSQFFGAAKAILLCTPDLAYDDNHPLNTVCEIDRVEGPEQAAEQRSTMIQFADAQYAAIGTHHRRLQHRRIARSLRLEHPDYTDDVYLDRTINAFERAAGYGAVDLDDLESFVKLDLIHGPGFEVDHAQAAAILSDETRLIGSRLRELSWIMDAGMQEVG